MIAGGSQGPELVSGSLKLAHSKGPYDAVLLQGVRHRTASRCERVTKQPCLPSKLLSSALDPFMPHLLIRAAALRCCPASGTILSSILLSPDDSHHTAGDPPPSHPEHAGTSLELVDKPGLKRWWQQEALLELLSMFGDGEEGTATGGLLCADVVLEVGKNGCPVC